MTTILPGGSGSVRLMPRPSAAGGGVPSHFRLLALATLLAVAAGSASAMVWFKSWTPTSVGSGQGYSVGAEFSCLHDFEIYCWPEITIYKNGNVFAHAFSTTPGGVETSEWTTDYGAQTVEYVAEATDHVDSYQYDYWWVEIS